MKSNELIPTKPDVSLNPDVIQPKAKPVQGSKNLFWMWLLLILAVLYVLSPIDFLPDLIPVAGWLDDVVVALTAISIALPKIIKRNS
jgi:uncharacterized membrane protein YkvA (DUF1232 family)